MEPSKCGYDCDLFVSDIFPYKCPICSFVLREPVQTTCGHRFCSHCLETWGQQQTGQTCPVCQQEPLDFFPDNCIKREVLQLHVACPNKGCTFASNLLGLNIHLSDKCEMWPCPNNCGDTFSKVGKQNHLANACSLRMVCCKYCREAVQFAKRSHHFREACEKRIVTCDFCGETVTVNKYTAHKNVQCAEYEVKCAFRDYGCVDRIKPTNMSTHLTEQASKHCTLLLKGVKTATMAADRANKKLDTLKTEMKRLQVEAKAKDDKIQHLSKRVQLLEEK